MRFLFSFFFFSFFGFKEYFPYNAVFSFVDGVTKWKKKKMVQGPNLALYLLGSCGKARPGGF